MLFSLLLCVFLDFSHLTPYILMQTAAPASKANIQSYDRPSSAICSDSYHQVQST